MGCVGAAKLQLDISGGSCEVTSAVPCLEVAFLISMAQEIAVHLSRVRPRSHALSICTEYIQICLCVRDEELSDRDDATSQRKQPDTHYY